MAPEAPSSFISLTKAQADVIRAGLMENTNDFRPIWTKVGKAAGLKAHRNGGRHFRDAIAVLGLALDHGKFTEIAKNNVTDDDDDNDDDDDDKKTKAVKGKKRKAIVSVSEEDGISKKMKKTDEEADNDEGGEDSLAV